MNRDYIILDFKYSFNGTEHHIFPVVLLGKNDIVLIDCGYPGSLELLETQLKYHNIKPDSLTKLVLTHQDDDHIGAAAEIKAKYPNIQIIASYIEEPYISGKLKNLRLKQAEEIQSQLPDSQKEFGKQFCDRFRNLIPVSIDSLLYSGDKFDWGGGCEIIYTPGHTPGHISIRALDNSFMISGDAAVVEDNELVIANPEYCLDIEEAKKSLEMIVNYDCQQYICYHGGLLKK